MIDQPLNTDRNNVIDFSQHWQEKHPHETPYKPNTSTNLPDAEKFIVMFEKKERLKIDEALDRCIRLSDLRLEHGINTEECTNYSKELNSYTLSQLTKEVLDIDDLEITAHPDYWAVLSRIFAQRFRDRVALFSQTGEYPEAEEEIVESERRAV